MLSESKTRFCFPRALRIAGRRDFEAVFKSGRRHKCPHFQVFALFSQTDDCPSKLGLVVGRRNGGAVERNLIKRRLREFFRNSQHRIRHGGLIVIRAFPGSAQTSYKALSAEISEAFERLCVWM